MTMTSTSDQFPRRDPHDLPQVFTLTDHSARPVSGIICRSPSDDLARISALGRVRREVAHGLNGINVLCPRPAAGARWDSALEGQL